MTDEISKLLEQAETPLHRSLILILMEQARNTLALTVSMQQIATTFSEHRVEFAAHKELTQKLDTKFDAHVIEEGGMLTWGLRVFSVVSGLLVFIVGLFGWYVVRHVIDVNAAQQATIDVNSNRLTALETMVREFTEKHKELR